MTDHLNPGLVCLIVWHNGVLKAVSGTPLLMIFCWMSLLTRSQESGAASTAVEQQ